MIIFTIGHSTRTSDEFISLVQACHIDAIVDVRSIPRSRTNPQFNPDVFATSLAQAGMAYYHNAPLGGLRHRARGASPSRNTLWRVKSFQNYADYATTAPFRAGLDQLLDTATMARCAIMCAEAVWWRCHRRIISDYLLTAGASVEHIMGAGKVEPAHLTGGACPQPDGTVLYPPSGQLEPADGDRYR